MAAGLMLAASAFAADAGRDFNALLQGEYMVTGFAGCITSPGGFAPNTFTPLSGVARTNTQTVQGTRIFNGDGTGTDVGVSVSINDESAGFPGGVSSSRFSGTFTYTVNPDLTVRIINAPFDSVNGPGSAAGQTFRLSDIPPFVGRISEDLSTIIVHHEVPAVEKISDSSGNVVNFRICARERTATKVRRSH